MIYEVIIGFGLLLYLLWKFLLLKKQSSSNLLDKTVNEEKYLAAVAKQSLSYDCIDTDEVDKSKKYDESVEDKLDHVDVFEKNLLPIVNNVEIVERTTSKYVYDESADQNKIFHKRASPPKERLTEFLEKTILNDDKLQSIIQSLSLDTADFMSGKSFDFSENSSSDGNALNGLPQKDSIIENSVDKFVAVDAIKDNEINKNYIIQKEENIVVENKPLLRRLQTQPVGLHFGSVIGELKSKTRNANGGLKPVFKKFEADAVNDVQACPFNIYIS